MASLAQAGVGCGASRAVDSSQPGPHPDLERVVRRHLATAWRAPIHRHTTDCFTRLCELLDPSELGRLVLDSGCGTGVSTVRLSEHHPDCVILGVDRSAHRLARSAGSSLPRREGNAIWVRAELGSFWRLALAAGWRLKHHYLLYPNPWPKAGHLRHRWHAHPAFPALLALGGEIELRCNWLIYAEEFALAAGCAGQDVGPPEPMGYSEPLSPFEAKYAASGHALFRVRFKVKKSPGFPGLSSATKVHSS